MMVDIDMIRNMQTNNNDYMRFMLRVQSIGLEEKPVQNEDVSLILVVTTNVFYFIFHHAFLEI